MKTVEMKDNCLLIDGSPVVLLSSSLFYFRIPQEYWEKRIVQLKACGYRAIDVYIPWNFHETAPGVWDFSGMRDIASFLRLAAENGLYVVARPGPYICSEWDGGALPAWLGTREMQLRQYDSTYLDAVKTWFDKIFPILEHYQYGRNGSVILLQLENELDIYQCREPKLYLEALYKMTEKYGFQIPMVVCTSSQMDVDYCGGTAGGTHPAFNIYSAPDHPALEGKMQIIWEKLKRTKDPFLTTETNREHYFLRRELAGGIRLISPYCQTASANYDCYTGISTWGNNRENPVSYMTNDYDHGAMIRADGLVTQEYLEARLLGNLVAAMGTELAAGTPDFNCDMETEEDYCRKALQKSAINLKSGGKLFCLPNLSEKAGRAVIKFEENEILVPVNAHTTLLLPFRLPLKAWGLQNAEIIWSSLEILSLERTDSHSWKLVLYGGGSGACLRAGDQKYLLLPGDEKCIPLSDTELLYVQAVTRDQAARMETAYLPPFEENLPGEPAAVQLQELAAEDFHFTQPERNEEIAFMESYGIYDGAVQYSFDLPEGTKGLLLDGAADIVQVSTDGRALPAYYGKVGMLCVPAEGKSAEVRVECWGHNCGHGIGYSVIQLGSLKGMRRAFGILEENRIQYNWQYYVLPDSTAKVLRLPAREWPAVTDFGDRLPLDLEEMQVYQKSLKMPEKGTHRFIHLEGGNIPVRVFINGTLEGTIARENRWLDISDAARAGQPVNLALCYPAPGLNPDPGHVSIIAAQKIESCRLGLYPAKAWKNIKVFSGEKRILPVSLSAGEIKKLTFTLSAQDLKKEQWISFTGRGVKMTVIGGGHVLGRIFVNCRMPGISVCSGDPDRIWLPSALFSQCPQVMLTAEALEENACLEKILLETRYR